jgi:hypothetical protein
LSADVNLGVSFGGLDVITVRQVAREDLSVAKARAPRSKNNQKRKPVVLVRAPPTPTLITPPSNGIGTTSPPGEDIQGPLPVDYGLKLEAEFSLEMVLEMQENTI